MTEGSCSLPGQATLMHMSSTRSFHPDLVSAPDVPQPSFKGSHAKRFIKKYQHRTREVRNLVKIVLIRDVTLLCNNCVSWVSHRLRLNRPRANMTSALASDYRNALTTSKLVKETAAPSQLLS